MDIGLLEIRGRGINPRTGSTNCRRFMGVVSRSAPIARCVRQPVMSTSVKSNVRVPGDIKTISVDDVYMLAERERARSCHRNRRHVLEKAQKDVRHDEGISRPHSSSSHFLHKRRSFVSSLTQKSRMSSAHSTVKPNTPDEDVDVSASLHCCEVMGPSICQVCRKASSRASSRERADASFPNLRVTQQNITTSALVKRLYPKMSSEDIHTKIARGEIARSYLPKALQSVPQSQADNTSRHDMKQNERTIFTIARMKQRLKNKGAPTTPMYFHNIRDLNFKIMSGRVSRELGFDKLVPSFKGEINIDDNEHSSSNSLFPVFVSPRKVTMYKEPSYKTYFAPPLLPRASQKPEPSFFAGSNFEYKLPERLPDKLVFIDTVKGRLSSAMSHGSDDTQDTENLSLDKEETT